MDAASAIKSATSPGLGMGAKARASAPEQGNRAMVQRRVAGRMVAIASKMAVVLYNS